MSDVELKPTKKRHTSQVWNYFTREGKNDYATCNICKKSFHYRSSTSNLKRHFEVKHRKHEESDSLLNNTSGLAEEYESIGVHYEVDGNEESVPMLIKKAPIKYTSNNHSHVMRKKLNTSISGNNKDAMMINDAINILHSLKNREPDPDDNDEFAFFGKFVTDRLKQLPILNALHMQEKIYCLLNRERISVMRNITDVHSYGMKSFSESESQELKDNSMVANEWLEKQNETEEEPIQIEIQSYSNIDQSEIMKDD
uniref:BED-type domain-containing protein n=1 Tax=Clastoptera arizonana TaxID=38151 RepID=A0A1B6EFX7_9HEMI